VGFQSCEHCAAALPHIENASTDPHALAHAIEFLCGFMLMTSSMILVLGW
jgi:hypothetical protein